MNRITRNLLLISIVGTLLAGCQSTQPKRDPAYAPVDPVVPQPAQHTNGAIYQAGFERSWFENVRARRVGDILLVTLVEDTEAKHTNSGSLSKSTSSSIANPVLLGNPLQFRVDAINGSNGQTLQNSLSSTHDFEGDADNTQNNEFTGSISVMVTQVFANGYLKVRGEKRIQMTGGNEYIRVSGIVRPEDIGTDNTIDSTKIADATLTYVGDGQSSAATQMGWLARFFASTFMPF